MRMILFSSVYFIVGLLGINDCHAQGVGKEGNRAVGVVFHADGTPFRAGEAAIGIFRREDATKDYTNADGVFCIVVPKGVTVFQLVYRAAGYWGAFSAEIVSNKDPIKVEKVLLRKKDPNDNAQLEIIDTLLQIEFAIYQGTSSLSQKKAMREELIKLSDSIEIPPPDPTETLLTPERILKINARVSIDTVVFKMK